MLLGALLCLGACDSAKHSSSTPTTTSLPSPFATLAPAPTPRDVPAGWSVLAGPHFSLAYPAGWALQTVPPNVTFSGTVFIFLLPGGTDSGVRITVTAQARTSDLGAYCLPTGAGIRRVAMAGLPMAYTVSGERPLYRSWYFANAQHTAYALQAGDTDASIATQEEDAAIFATFTPDDTTPLRC
jgi:hypothetical protein